MAFVRKNKGSLVRLDASEYVGEAGYLFWDVETGENRMSDGITPGGLPIPHDEGVAVWGKIIGVLTEQTDLQTALNLKADATDLSNLDTQVSDNTLAITDLQANKEDDLGDPVTDGYILSSLADGTRSWKVDSSGTDENAIWGNITGLLSDQGDLQTALNLKADATDLSDLDTQVSDNILAITDLETNKEDDLGDPALDGYILSSLADGTRSWKVDSSGTDENAIWGNITGLLSDQGDLQTALNLKVDDTQVLTDVPIGALFTDTIYDDTAIQAEVDLNTAKTGISAQQASDITSNNAKVSYTDAALVATHTTDINNNAIAIGNNTTAIGTKIGNVIEDLTPQLGGPLGTEGHNIFITDVAGVIEGALVKSPNGIALTYTGIDGIYEDTDGGIELAPSKVSIHGTAVDVQSLTGTDVNQVYVSPAGVLYTVSPPVPGWEETDTSADTTGLGNGKTEGPWIEITDLTVTPFADVPAGSRLNIYTNLYVENTAPDSGVINIGIGINGSAPASAGVAKGVAEQSESRIPAGISTSAHGGLITTDTLTLWIQRGASAKNSNISLRGDITAHEFTVSVPGDSGASTGAIWGDITGLLSDQGDLQTALNLKADDSALTITDNNVSTNTTNIGLKEDDLGDPVADGYILSSLADGTRSWVDTSGTVIGDFASVSVGIPATIALQTSFENVDFFNITYLENRTSVVAHDPINTDRILINESGLYYVSFSASPNGDAGEESVEMQVLINDTTVAPGSLRALSFKDDTQNLGNWCPVELTAGDYITLQVKQTGAGNTLTAVTFVVTRAGGVAGAQGTAGPAGNSKEFFQGTNGAVTQTFATSTTLNFGSVIRNDASYVSASVVGGTEVTINTAGWYRIVYGVTAISTARVKATASNILELNGVEIPGSLRRSYHRDNRAPGSTSSQGEIILQLASSDVIRITSSSPESITTVANGCSLLIEGIL